MRLLPVLAMLLFALNLLAQPGPELVPPAERAPAQVRELDGPSENRGIETIRPVGSVPLKGEIASAEDSMLRARELVILPGGIVAVHRHQQRPGIAYLLAGEMVEHRSDHAEPLLRRAGDAAFEFNGLEHWWENRSEAPARALVVDIVPVDE